MLPVNLQPFDCMLRLQKDQIMLRDDRRRLGCYLLIALVLATIALLALIYSESDPKWLPNEVPQSVK